MIDPVNPGPAGTTGPAGSQITASGPGDITPLLAAGTAVISQAMQTATGAIQSLFNQAFATVQGAIAKAAGSIASGYNSAETTLVTAGAQAQSATAATVNTALGPTGGGGPAGPSATEGQYAWNVYQYIIAPYPARAVQGVGIPGAPAKLWCYRGGWDNGLDAVRYSLSISGSPPPPGCILPGGPTAPPGSGPGGPGPCDSNVYRVWQQFLPDGSANCVELCQGVQGPAGYKDMGQSLSPGANAPVGTVYQCLAPTKPSGGGNQYYAGCVSGQAVAWLSSDQAPSGVSGQVGPFADQGTALAAASCGSVGTGPPSGGPPSGTGQCCPTEVTKLPDCIQIDLCSPEKVAMAIYLGMCKWSTDDSCFYDPIWRAIKKGLCEFIADPKCRCNLDDADRSMWEDCSGAFGQTILGIMGSAGAPVSNMTLDEVVSEAMQASGLGG